VVIDALLNEFKYIFHYVVIDALLNEFKYIFHYVVIDAMLVFRVRWSLPAKPGDRPGQLVSGPVFVLCSLFFVPYSLFLILSSLP